MLAFYQKLVNTGVTPQMNPQLEKSIRLCNSICILFSVCIFIFTIVFWANGLGWLGFLSLIWFFSTFFWLGANYFKKYNFSRFGLLIITQIIGGFFCWYLGKEIHFYTGFFAVVGSPILLFGFVKKEHKYIIPLILISVACYFLIDWHLHTQSDLPSFPQTAATSMKIIIEVITFAIIALSMFYLLSATQKSEERLREAQSTLIQNSKLSALGEMAGGIAHEINTPLAIIKTNAGQASELLDDPIPDKTLLKQMLQSIEKTTERIAKIIQGLRAFSRDGKQDAPQKVNVHELILETLSLCHEKFKNHDIKIEYQPLKTDVFFNGQAVQVSQVLLNLLSNAYDAIVKNKNKWIKINVLELDNEIEVRVTDSGTGIAPDLHEKIFQPFFTTKEIGKGTGLGLSVSGKLIEGQGGRLFLDTHSPHTSFVIRLPC